MNNYQRTAAWLAACGKEPNAENLSVQIGCHIEEFCEFLSTLELTEKEHVDIDWDVPPAIWLSQLAVCIKRGQIVAKIQDQKREEALDALCDCEVTGNGVAYLAGFLKVDADEAVLASNEAKLVEGKPVLLPGGKIGKPDGWTAPDLSGFV